MWYIQKGSFDIRNMTRKEAAALNRDLPPQKVWESGRNPHETLHTYEYCEFDKSLKNEVGKLEKEKREFETDYIEKNEKLISSFIEKWNKAVKEGDEKIIIEGAKVFSIPFAVDYSSGSLDFYNEKINFGCSDSGFGCMDCHTGNQKWFAKGIAEIAWLHEHGGINIISKLNELNSKKLQEFADEPIYLIEALKKGYKIFTSFYLKT